MFKKLRNKLIFLNLGILTVLLLVIFGSLYISTYREIHTRVDFELESLLVPPTPGLPGEPITDPLVGDPIKNISFVLEVVDGEIIESLSRIDFTDEYFESVFAEVNDDQGTITIGGQTWSYKSNEMPNNTIYAFINITNDQQLLTDTLTSYSIIFVISLFLVALISYFMTNRSIKPVRESFDKQKQFVSDASHELKTPLTVINANVDVLLSQNTNKKDKKWLEYIQKEVVRMNKLTHNLLYLATVSDSDTTFTQSNINASTEIESIVLGVEALAYEKDIKLHYDISPNITVKFNQEHFNQAIMILLDNAIKYTPNKGVINVELLPLKDSVFFTIRNTGDGIPEEDLPRLFDRFYKVDDSRKNTSNSYGLGLSILKAICDQNNAKIKVDSSVNEYTEFKLRFQTK